MTEFRETAQTGSTLFVMGLVGWEKDGHAFFQPAGIFPRQMVRMLASFGVVHHGALGRGAIGDAIHQLASEFLPIRVHQP